MQLACTLAGADPVRPKWDQMTPLKHKVKFWDRYCTLASFSLCRRSIDKMQGREEECGHTKTGKSEETLRPSVLLLLLQHLMLMFFSHLSPPCHHSAWGILRHVAILNSWTHKISLCLKDGNSLAVPVAVKNDGGSEVSTSGESFYLSKSLTTVKANV
ncbi:hypothetical protein YC2023_038723 [Brassica napus]